MTKFVDSLTVTELTQLRVALNNKTLDPNSFEPNEAELKKWANRLTKIEAIRMHRSRTNLGLKESKTIFDNMPLAAYHQWIPVEAVKALPIPTSFELNLWNVGECGTAIFDLTKRTRCTENEAKQAFAEAVK